MMSYLSKVAVFTCVVVHISSSVLAQETSLQSEPKTVAKKTFRSPVAKPDERANVEFTDYELIWPTIKTHSSSRLSVSGGKVRWSQQFADGEAPVFNAIEEDFEAGSYFFRVEYTSNDAYKEKKEREDARSNRRKLLSQRLELMRKGDADGAKALLERTNRIRSRILEKDMKARSGDGKQQENEEAKYITRTGRFMVTDDGKVEVYDLKKQQDELAKKNKESHKQKKVDEPRASRRAAPFGEDKR